MRDQISAHADITDVENSAQATAELARAEKSTQAITQMQTVAMQLDPQLLQKLEKLKGQSDWNELFAQLLEERDEQLEKEKPAAIKTTNRYIPAKIVHYLIKRTNGTCAFPGCLKPYDVIHHTDRFSRSKTHDPDKMQILCDAHHQIAHHGLIENEECQAETWQITTTADPSA